MLFVIEYNRLAGKLLKLRKFDDLDKRLAEKARMELDIEANRLRADHEIVILQAANEADLRRTHRRYFENFADLMKAS